MKFKIFTILFLSILFVLSGHTRSNLLYLDTIPNSNSIDTISVTSEFNLLRSPQSPAASIFDIAQSEIRRPTSPTDFMLSIGQSTNNFSQLPSTYAIDLAPYYLWGNKLPKNSKFTSNKISDNLKQSLVLSLALQTQSSDSLNANNPGVAIGFNVSLLRGSISDKTKDKIKQSYFALKKVNDRKVKELQEAIKNAQNSQLDTLIQVYVDSLSKLSIESNLYAKEIKNLEDLLIELNKVRFKKFDHNGISAEENEKFIKIAEDIDFTRKGLKVDFSGAIYWKFPNDLFSQRELGSASIWLTAGYEEVKNSKFSILSLARYRYNMNELLLDMDSNVVEENVSSFDAGLRTLYSINKLTASLEAVYRLPLNLQDQFDPSGRIKWQFITTYTLSNNLNLSLTLGKDFQNNITKEGNVISALNFIKGFGAKRTTKISTQSL